MGVAEERELEGMKREMDTLAVHLEEVDIDIVSDAVSGILRCLLAGHTSDSIISDFALEEEDGV